MDDEKKKSVLRHEILNALTVLGFVTDELPEDERKKAASAVHMAGLMVKYEPLILGESAKTFMEELSLKELMDLVLTVNEDVLRQAVVTGPDGDLKVKGDRNQTKEMLSLLIAVVIESASEIKFEIEKKSLRVLYQGKAIEQPTMEMLDCLQKKDMLGFQLGLIEALGKLNGVGVEYAKKEIRLNFI